MKAIAYVDQLGGDAQLGAGLANAAFEDSSGIQLAADLAHVLMVPLEPEYRRPGDHL